jgi:hypothetical protein
MEQLETMHAPGLMSGVQLVKKAKHAPRWLSTSPLTDVEQIWEIAEERFGGSRDHFLLIYSGSTYLQPEDTLPKPQQFFEIRYQGRAGSSHLM